MTGDIILQKRSGIIGYIVSFFTGSPWVHAGIDIGNSTVVHVDTYGKHYTWIADWGPNIVRLTPVEPLPTDKQFYLVQHCDRTTVLSYDFIGAIMSFFYKDPDDSKVITKKYHCSGFISAMYRKIGIDLVANRSDESTQPQDFLMSPLLRLVES